MTDNAGKEQDRVTTYFVRDGKVLSVERHPSVSLLDNYDLATQMFRYRGRAAREGDAVVVDRPKELKYKGDLEPYPSFKAGVQVYKLYGNRVDVEPSGHLAEQSVEAWKKAQQQKQPKMTLGRHH